MAEKVIKRKPPKRPEFGTKGAEIKVLANHYPIGFDSNATIIHYDVQFNPEVKNKDELRRIFQILKEIYADIFQRTTAAFDGSRNMYTAKRLSGIGKEAKTFTVEREVGSKMKQVKIQVKEVQLVQLQDLARALRGDSDIPYTALQALDVILRHTLSNRFTVVFRAIYPEPDRNGYRDLGRGHVAWLGYYQSARPTQSGLSLNIDTSHTTFISSMLVSDYVDTYFNRDVDRLNDRERRHFSLELKNVKVTAVHTNGRRKYNISDVSTKSASQIFFDADGRKVSVAEYLAVRYNQKLTRPSLPCLKLNNRDIHLPMELCRIVPGQYYKRKLSEAETSSMVRFAAIPAIERKNKIRGFVSDIAKYNQDKMIQGAQLNIANNMKEVQARILPTVTVLYDNSEVKPRDGSWNMQGLRFIASCVVRRWGCISLPDRGLNPRKIQNFLADLCSSARSYGISGLAQDTIMEPPYKLDNVSQFDNVVRKWMHKSNNQLNLVVCIIPGNRIENYKYIKTMADLDMGLVTQCIKAANLQRANKQYFANVILKINAKIGGINNSVKRSPVLSRPTMVFGADVTHPSIGDTTSPSIAAIVGSASSNLGSYFHALRVQNHRVEIIKDLEEVVFEMLRAFLGKVNRYPDRIVFYRDGVSEGQFMDVLREELTAIEHACRRVNRDYRPTITFVVVQKHHHTRFFPSRPADAVGKSGNVPPGLMVDRSVCHPSEYDFYLVSHYGIQGTSRPTHYHVLWDENKFAVNDLQQFTYELCHLYCRCTRSVSIPAPVYYSHHLAFRARYYVSQLLGDRMTPAEIKEKLSTSLRNKYDKGAVFFA